MTFKNIKMMILNKNKKVKHEIFHKIPLAKTHKRKKIESLTTRLIPSIP